MKDFHHQSVRSVGEAVDLLGKHVGRAKLNAGGTDLLGLLKDRIIPDYPELIINIKDIQDLNYIRESEEGLRIGAITKLGAIAESQLVKQKYGILAEAARSVASPQIRNMCTIGGNLAQDVRCWYYRYPDQLGGTVMCLRKGGAVCNALAGDNRYHSIFGTTALGSYPCTSHCPAGTAIPSYLAHMKNGEFMEAAATFLDFNPMPAVTGRVCPTYCEPECKRKEFDEPVAIRCVERSLGDYMLEHTADVYAGPETESGKRIAIIGSGPAGLAAAYYLRREGHAVTIYERFSEAGGMLFYSIPGYRLPRDVVRKQVEALQGMGIIFKLGTNVGKDVAVEELANRFDSVLVATGAWKEKAQAITGDAPSLSGLEFLKKVNEGDRSIPGRKVAVIGGGNVAIDVARTLVRLGSKPTILYRRTRKEMPAFADEVEKAREEGVSFHFLTLPAHMAEVDGKISLTSVKMKLGAIDASGRRQPSPREGSEFTATFDAVIRATGEEPDPEFLPRSVRKKTGKGASDRLLGQNIYMAGDFMNGSSTVIEAVASGREAARLINKSFVALAEGVEKPQRAAGFAPAVYEAAPRLAVSDRSVAERLKSPDGEDRPGVTRDEAEREAGRCFNCGCVAVNPSDIAVALTALDAKIVTTKRSVHAAAFFAPDAMASTILDKDEMITEIQIPPVPDGARQDYSKFTLRKPIDFAIVSVATVFAAKDGVCTDARIALGAVAPAPFRAGAAEKKLIGKKVTAQVAAEAAEAALDGVKPLSKNAYKVDIMKTLVKRAIMGSHEKL
jgi:NADPH-dependent glutamate synthase beta subunit-like oxidoreductase